MPRGKRIERVYTGKAAKLDEKVKALEETLKAVKLNAKQLIKNSSKKNVTPRKPKQLKDKRIF